MFPDRRSVTANKNGIIRLFICLFVCCLAQEPPLDRGQLIHEVSSSHATTHYDW